MKAAALILSCVSALVWLSAAGFAAAQGEGWVIDRMDVEMTIETDGRLLVREAIDVDFRGLERHGIFRDLSYRFEYDAERIREYAYAFGPVTRADGQPHDVRESVEGSVRRLRIGDPDRTLSGLETYRLTYDVSGALNGFADHDELYWNASGTWPVPLSRASVTVTAPAGAIERVDCFQGGSGSTERCESAMTAGEVVFRTTRALAAGEQLTIVVGLRKGAVADPQPRLLARGSIAEARRSLSSRFATGPRFVLPAAAGIVLVACAVGLLWWRVGRDRQYVAVYHEPSAAGEEPVPLLGARPVGVEFEPPEGIRPGQMGLLVDERADTLDVTATIIDLATRGYLTIEEIPKSGWFGRKDWQLHRTKDADAGLLAYERIVFDGLFDGRATRQISSLKEKFYKDLAKAKSALYRDGVDRGWFPRNPNAVRMITRVAGAIITALGVVLAIALGERWGAGLLGVPVVAGGILLLAMAGAMPRRTAKGRTVLLRTLGFVKYIRTGEARQLAFAERANIFTAYLPYAVAFKCVDKWARAFADIDVEAATSRWYTGTGGFNASSLHASLGSFSHSVSNTLASTPGGSGGSGFSGGSSGGGGGSW